MMCVKYAGMFNNNNNNINNRNNNKNQYSRKENTYMGDTEPLPKTVTALRLF